MKYFAVVLFFIYPTACNWNDAFDKDYYERITQKPLPDNYKVLESFDNAEWLTGAVLKVDQATLRKYVAEHNFEILKNKEDIRLMSNSYLKQHKLAVTTGTEFYFKHHETKDNNWTYVADLHEEKLYIEIVYKDQMPK